MKHNQRYEQQQKITGHRKSNESHLHWRKRFHKNILRFKIIEDFDADKEIDNSIIGKKPTNNQKKNPVPNGYYIVSELDGVLKNVSFESPPGFDNVDCFVNEVMKKEKIKCLSILESLIKIL